MMKRDTSSVWLVFSVVFLILAVVWYFKVERPEKQACEDMGGEVINEHKSWHCEVPLHVVFKNAGL